MFRTQGTSSHGVLILLLAGLAMFGPFSIDTIFPVFPELARAMAVGPAQIQQTISVYLLAYGLMALLHGPLSDAYGRRAVVLGGVALFTLASVGCALAANYWALLLCRAVQGFSAGSGLIVGRAIIRDRFRDATAQRVMSRVTMLFAVAPALAPMVGGWIGTRWGWAAIFWFLAVFGALLGLACLRALPETLPSAARLPLSPGLLFARYGEMLRHQRFVLLAFSTGLNFAGTFVYIASAPVFVLEHLRLAPTQFVYFFGPMITGMMLGAYFSGRRAGRGTPETTIGLGYAVMACAGIVNVVYCVSVEQIAWPWAVVPVMLGSLGASLAFPTLTLQLLDLYPDERGTASSMQTFLQLMVSSTVAGVVSPLVSGRPWLLAVSGLCAVSLGAVCWRGSACFPARVHVTFAAGTRI
jgi:DHA1 family bicyclomycin/chloramphenicol resistance-like MFS transporter